MKKMSFIDRISAGTADNAFKMGPLARLSFLSRQVSTRLKKFPNKKVLVLEGGGMRAIFQVGLLQAFYERDYMPWRLIIGTSAGALVGAAYAAGQIHLARDSFFTELLDGAFIRMRNLFRPEKHVLNLDWMVDNIVGGDDPLRMQRLRMLSPPVLMPATRFREDEYPQTVYLSTKTDTILQSLKATAAIPFFYRGFIPYRGEMFIDGSVLDPIPYKKALDMGFHPDEILVVRTRPKGYFKLRESFWIKMLYESYYKDPRYKQLLASFNEHYSLYNRLVDDLENRYCIDTIYPPKEYKVNRLTQNEEKILDGFEQGVMAAKEYLFPWNTANTESKP